MTVKTDIMLALQNAFPQLSDVPITSEAIAEIGAEYVKMKMNWTPIKERIEFLDQEGNTREIVSREFSSHSSDKTLTAYTIAEDADWVAIDEEEVAAWL